MNEFLTNDTKVIILLCGFFGNDKSIKPLPQSKYNLLARWLHSNKMRPEDLLEKENPEIFKNKNLKFIDLYTKSGLYLTELVKRLTMGLKDEIPDETERITHILENQIYLYNE